MTRRTGVLTGFALLMISAVGFAQRPAVEVYRVRVVREAGPSLRGILYDVTDTKLFLDGDFGDEEGIPLSTIRKVVVFRHEKRAGAVTGAILGGLAIGYISNQSLQRNPPQSPVAYGLTLTLATVGGAGIGLVLGSTISGLSHRVVRPDRRQETTRSLERQLKPFSLRYQSDVLNRLPPP